MECSDLACHEIASGPNRDKALDKPYAILVVCSYCNCHVLTDRQRWPESRQLALLFRKRPKRFDLVAYNHLVNENAPLRITMEDIGQWLTPRK